MPLYHTKCVSLSNQKCTTQPTLINLHPNEYTKGLLLSICSYNTLNDLSNEVYFPNKTEDLYLNVFNGITGKNELKTLMKHKSCEYKGKYDGKKCNLNQYWKNGKCQCEMSIKQF